MIKFSPIFFRADSARGGKTGLFADFVGADNVSEVMRTGLSLIVFQSE